MDAAAVAAAERVASSGESDADRASAGNDDDGPPDMAEHHLGSATAPLHLSIHALSTAADDQPTASPASPPFDREGAPDLDSAQRSSPGLQPLADREELSRRLRRIFDLDQTEELVSCHPCWLFRSILLQGYMYIMTSHLCFYAYLPSRQDKVLWAGSLRKRTRRTHRFSKHWTVLRGRALSWYESERDPYFPQDQIDLRDVIEVSSPAHARDSNTAERSGAMPGQSTSTQHGAELSRFEVTTPYRVFTFEAQDRSSCDHWVTAIRKAAFRAQNEGESVRISIPLETILDVDSSAANPLAGHTSKAEQGMGIQDVAVVTIKVIHSNTGEAELTMDEYFFTNMADEAQFIHLLRERMVHFAQAQQLGPIRGPIGGSVSTSLAKPIAIPSSVRRSGSLKGSDTPTSAKMIPATLPGPELEAQLADAVTPSDFPHGTPPAAANLSTSVKTLRSSDVQTYPPSPPPGAPSHLAMSTLSISSSSSNERKWAVPQWLREVSSRLTSNTSDNIQALASRIPRRAIRETWSAMPPQAQGEVHEHDDMIDRQSSTLSPQHKAENEEDMESSIHSAYSILEAHDAEIDTDLKEQEILDQFRRYFSLPDSEQVLHHTSTSLYRVLPVAGRMFVSRNYVCFRSSALATKTMGRTLMILPRSEIISVAKNNAVQYGRHGLVVIVRGHEELFFEFTSTQRRDQCISTLELEQQSNDELLSPLPRNDDDGTDPGPFLLTDMGLPSDMNSETSSSLHTSPSLFASSSSFMPVKPREGMHFTFLTVGSRGDVQPYIALARGLMREGHRVRIATHDEFGKWIRSFGIEFREVGGDPAELMRICIENGTFTLAFVRESVTRFRGWLDDLLVSCWHACHGTDVIIESPSAIAGIHIAEKLGIPYYRAFTMPWTRTRAYPHAFAVPTRRAGGNYNYMSYVIFDQVFWRASAGQINAWRSRCLQLRPTNLDRLEQHKVPFLYNFSPHLVPKPLDWSDWIHVTGFWFLDNADETGQTQNWEAPPDLIAFIERARKNQRKLVYIGWGSIVISDSDAVLQVVVDAVRKSGVCAIISRGWSDRLQEEDQRGEAQDETQQQPTQGPDGAEGNRKANGEDVWQDIFTVRSVPHDWLFPQMDAACHHGGSGTLGASLRAGVPTIVRPFFGDQFFWASQVESLQIGASIANPFTADRFAAALTLCTSDPRMRRNARTLADAIAKEDGVSNAIRAIYADYDYACSQIKSHAQAGPSIAGTLSSVVAGEADEADEATLPSSVTIAIAAQKAVEQADDDEARSMDEWSVVSGSEEGIAGHAGPAVDASVAI